MDVVEGLGEEMEGVGEEMVAVEGFGEEMEAGEGLVNFGEVEDDGGLAEAVVSTGNVGGARRVQEIDWIEFPLLALSMNSLFLFGDVSALCGFLVNRCSVCLSYPRSNQFIVVYDCRHWFHPSCNQKFEEAGRSFRCPLCRCGDASNHVIFLHDLEEEDDSTESSDDDTVPVAREYVEFVDRNCSECGSDYIIGRTFHSCLVCGVSRCDNCYSARITCECGSDEYDSLRFGVPPTDAHNNSESDVDSLDVVYGLDDWEERNGDFEDVDAEWENPDYVDAEWENPDYLE